VTFETAIFMVLFGAKTCGVPEKPCKSLLFHSQIELAEYLKTHSPKRNQHIYTIKLSGPISLGGNPSPSNPFGGSH